MFQQEKIPEKNARKTQNRLPQLNLRLETGRYDKIPLDEKICSFCSGNKIEEETHLLPVLRDCQRYSSMRDIFLSKIETKIDDIRKLSHENLISQLMNCID